MTTEPTASIEPSRRSLRRVTAAAVVGGALLLAGIGVAAAQTDDSTPPASDPPAAGAPAPAAKAGPRGDGMRPGPGGGKHGGPGGHAVHGEFVVPDGNGGFRTMQVQNGTVTAVSNSSITVKSADGFTKTYVVDEETRVNAGRDGIADVAEGDTVHVDAVVDGGASKARHIHERPAKPAGEGGPRAQRQQQQQQQQPAA